MLLEVVNVQQHQRAPQGASTLLRTWLVTDLFKGGAVVDAGQRVMAGGAELLILAFLAGVDIPQTEQAIDVLGDSAP